MTPAKFLAASAVALCFLGMPVFANEEESVQLQHAAHVCNDEQETVRLAANDHLREMAKALVEFKATKFCFIMQPSQKVTLLEHHGNYIKFSHDNKILYTFIEHLLPNEPMLTQQR